MVLQRRLERRSHEDDDEIFQKKMIGKKLRNFLEHKKFFVKQELNNVSYNHG